MSWSRVEAVELICRMGGYSAPILARTSDGTYHVVKFQSRVRHARALANELIAARLGQLVGLPIPDHSIVSVSTALIRGRPHLALAMATETRRYSAGLHFGSRYVGIPGETIVVDFLPEAQLRTVSNRRAAFWGGLVFDLWSAHCDERGMVFNRRARSLDGSYTAWLIDHEQCFAGERWTLPDDPLLSAYSRPRVYEGIEGLSSFEPFISRIEQLEPKEISHCTESIPAKWVGEPKQELQQLARQLCDRRKWVRGAILRTRSAYPSLFSSWRLAA